METIAPIGELLRDCADPAAAVRQGAHVNVAQDARLLAQTDDFILRHMRPMDRGSPSPATEKCMAERITFVIGLWVLGMLVSMPNEFSSEAPK